MNWSYLAVKIWLYKLWLRLCPHYLPVDAYHQRMWYTSDMKQIHIATYQGFCRWCGVWLDWYG